MRKALEVLVLFVGICSAASARAGDVTPTRCGPNQDRVWVYDSLTTFDVQSKIRCGETVEIVGRVKGFVKVRTQDGSEGYIPDSALPSASPQEDRGVKSADANAGASTASLGSIARRVTASPAAPPAHPTDTSNGIPNTADSHVPVASPVTVSVPSRSFPASTQGPSRSTGITDTGVVTASMSAVSMTRSGVAPAAVAVALLPTAAAPPSNAKPTQSISKSTSTGAGVGAMYPTPSRESATATASATSAVNSNAKSTSSAASRAIPAGAKSNTPQPPAGNAHLNPPASSPAPALQISTPAINTTTAANFSVPSLAGEMPSMRPVSATVDSDEFPDFQPVSDSADPACQSFFSAYGLAPSQLKWIAQNRKKRFPSICPAPDPTKVDFVVIFTHDVDVYNSTLPVSVHTDRNGFSDFSPMVGVDTALVSISAADKARHEFVWVFLMKRGTFDPATFSPRRRYQFTKVESNSLGSKAGAKTIEDAFQFVVLGGPNH